jgi:hypothetical protein
MMISLKMLYHSKFQEQGLLFDVHLCAPRDLFMLVLMELSIFVDIRSTGCLRVDCL